MHNEPLAFVEVFRCGPNRLADASEIGLPSPVLSHGPVLFGQRLTPFVFES